MYRKTLFWTVIVLALTVVSGESLGQTDSNLEGLAAEDSKMIRPRLVPEAIPEDLTNHEPGKAEPLRFDKGYCVVQNDNDSVQFYYAGWVSGEGFAVYMDPGQCGVYPYPFQITEVHFYLYDDGAVVWPVQIQVSVRDLVLGDKCNGPGDSLYSEIHSLPIDSAYPNLIHLDLYQPYWVTGPLFLEIVYTGGTDTPYPSLLMTDTSDVPDTCNDWFYFYDDTSFAYYEWYEMWLPWAPPWPGNAVIRAAGYTSEECIDPVHFVFTDNTEDSYSIVVDSALLDSMELEECDEIGVFADTGGGLLCVGASVYYPDDLPIPLTAWKDDSQTDIKDGYTPGDTMYFRVWSKNQDRQECALAYYEVGDGHFETGLFSQLWLEAPCIPPICGVDPDSLGFGTVMVGDSLDLTFTITNTGGGTLSDTVSEACEDYSLVGDSTYSLMAGQSDTFTVRFKPQSAGTKICTIGTGNDICSDVDCFGEGQEYSPVQVTLPDTCAESGDTVAIPIYVDDVTGQEIDSAEITLVYADSILGGNCDLTTTQNTIAENWGPPTCSSADGSISIAMAGVSPLSGSGVLVYVAFIVTGSSGVNTFIHFDHMQFNQGDPPSSCEDGLFRIVETPLCGDVNGDGDINSVDIVFMLDCLFKNGPCPCPWWVGDCNSDEEISSADVVCLIDYMFKGGPPPGC